jgi:hypothetical protein
MPTAAQLKADVARKEAALEEAKKAHEEAKAQVAIPRTPTLVMNEILTEICNRLGNRPLLEGLIAEFKDLLGEEHAASPAPPPAASESSAQSSSSSLA